MNKGEKCLLTCKCVAATQRARLATPPESSSVTCCAALRGSLGAARAPPARVHCYCPRCTAVSLLNKAPLSCVC